MISAIAFIASKAPASVSVRKTTVESAVFMTAGPLHAGEERMTCKSKFNWTMGQLMGRQKKEATLGSRPFFTEEDIEEPASPASDLSLHDSARRDPYAAGQIMSQPTKRNSAIGCCAA